MHSTFPIHLRIDLPYSSPVAYDSFELLRRLWLYLCCSATKEIATGLNEPIPPTHDEALEYVVEDELVEVITSIMVAHTFQQCQVCGARLVLVVHSTACQSWPHANNCTLVTILDIACGNHTVGCVVINRAMASYP